MNQSGSLCVLLGLLLMGFVAVVVELFSFGFLFGVFLDIKMTVTQASFPAIEILHEVFHRAYIAACCNWKIT